jgi:hypothetical protein
LPGAAVQQIFTSPQALPGQSSRTNRPANSYTGGAVAALS